MEIRAIKIQLLNHLFYHTEVSNGSISGGFIGDLALTYSLRNSISQNETLYECRLRPEYEEIKDFDFYFTVARPTKEIANKKTNNKKKLVSELKPQRTGSYTRNTLFNTDGFYDKQSIEKSGKSPFKNLIHTQGVALKNDFSDNYFLALLISKDKTEIPPCLRVGNQRETLLKLTEISFDEIDTDFWLNAFTLKIVFNNLEAAIKIAVANQNINYQFIIENYTLLKGFSKNQIEEIFKPIF